MHLLTVIFRTILDHRSFEAADIIIVRLPIMLNPGLSRLQFLFCKKKGVYRLIPRVDGIHMRLLNLSRSIKLFLFLNLLIFMFGTSSAEFSFVGKGGSLISGARSSAPRGTIFGCCFGSESPAGTGGSSKGGSLSSAPRGIIREARFPLGRAGEGGTIADIGVCGMYGDTGDPQPPLVVSFVSTFL